MRKKSKMSLFSDFLTISHYQMAQISSNFIELDRPWSYLSNEPPLDPFVGFLDEVMRKFTVGWITFCSAQCSTVALQISSHFWELVSSFPTSPWPSKSVKIKILFRGNENHIKRYDISYEIVYLLLPTPNFISSYLRFLWSKWPQIS